ncbi:MFS transporter [Neokomagataea anthophila]|uniref:MFS transporter n=1 Tax=Neokomagataea anthophila TaxID=2826925 RepID=A0ABS5E8G5_9PROT|nr:MFS transporter [Neokomagataea anthophila]MBR0560202.1 MFS transporter [Neokomagataea anthophila]
MLRILQRSPCKQRHTPQQLLLFKQRDYALWAAGTFVSNIGTWVQRTGQDWLALTELPHHSASLLGTVIALQFVSPILFLPWTGTLADRYDRRRLLIITQSTMAVLALCIGVLTITHHIDRWGLYILTFLFGTAASFDAPVRQVFIGDLVGDTALPAAVSFNSISFNAARFIGPAVGGAIISATSTGWTFLINGASFFAVLGSLFLLRTKRNTSRSSIQSQRFLDGLRYAWRKNELRSTLIMLALIGTFALNMSLFVATMAVHVFHASAGRYGLLSSIMAVGSVIGAALSGFNQKDRYHSLLLSAGLLGLSCTAAALAPTYWLFGITIISIGIAALLFTNTSNTLMQLATEPAYRGRVIALRIGVVLGGTPIGAPIAGWVADTFGPRWAITLGALSCYLALAVGIMIRPKRPYLSQ